MFYRLLPLIRSIGLYEASFLRCRDFKNYNLFNLGAADKGEYGERKNKMKDKLDEFIERFDRATIHYIITIAVSALTAVLVYYGLEK